MYIKQRKLLLYGSSSEKEFLFWNIGELWKYLSDIMKSF